MFTSAFLSKTWVKAFFLYILSQAATILYQLLIDHDVISVKTFIIPLAISVLPYIIKELSSANGQKLYSSLGQWWQNDTLKALIMFILSSIANIILEVINKNEVFSWQTIGYPLVIAVLPYIIKQLNQNSDGAILTKETNNNITK